MGSEFEILENRLSELQCEVLDLKRRDVSTRKRHRWMILTVLVVGFLAYFAPRGITHPETGNVVCKSLRVVDDQGRDRAVIGINETGGYLSLRGNNNIEQLFCGVNQAGGLVGFRATNGREQMVTGINEAGGNIGIFGTDRKEKVFVGVSGGGKTGVVEFNRGHVR